MNRKKILIVIIFFTILIITGLLIITRTDSYNSLSISQEKWDSILEKRKENLTLEIENIRFNEYDLIVDNSNSKLYYSIINDNDSSYNPSVSYKTNNKTKLVVLKDELDESKIGDYEFKIMIYNNSSYRTYRLVCTRFPILNITNKDKENDSSKQSILMQMYFFDNLKNSSNRILRSDGILNIENNNNYKMHLEVLSPGRNIRDNVISIMGMEPSSRYDLTKINSIQENRFKNEDKHIIELFIDNKYKGLYKIEVMK
ncbi:MAG: hypothetical protein IJ842_00975 [Bacilli bacterium]|nr:hypothetical protein [Bacilli bacterium]